MGYYPPTRRELARDQRGYNWEWEEAAKEARRYESSSCRWDGAGRVGE